MKGNIEPTTLKPCRVLLVEGDQDDQSLRKRELEASGLVTEINCFSNGEELMAYMQAEEFQDHTVLCSTPMLLIVDLKMPGMDGFQVLEMLKTDPFLESIPTIVVSGELSYETIRRALDLRADAVFRKPMNVEKLRQFFGRAWQWPTKEMWLA